MKLLMAALMLSFAPITMAGEMISTHSAVSEIETTSVFHNDKNKRRKKRVKRKRRRKCHRSARRNFAG